MSGPDDKDKRPKNENTPTAGDSGTDKRSGRVAFDSRGNPIWEWQLETGVYSRDVSTQKLKKLDLGDLSIAETARNKKPSGLEDPEQHEPGASTKQEPLPGGGFNPYDNTSSAGGRGFNPYDSARSAGSRVKPSQPPAAPERKPTDLRKLDAWIKLKKKLTGDKKED